MRTGIIALIATLLLIGGIANGASGKAEPASAVTSSPIESASPAELPNPTPSASGTATPSPTATPEPTPTPQSLLVVNAQGDPEPDRTLTPGETFVGATAQQVCIPGYSTSVRDVAKSTRLAVFAAYNIDYAQHAKFELDHLIPLELGGDNSVANLWPEPLDGAGGAKVKDRLENKLHALVCSGQVPLSEAQQAIQGDWYVAYNRYEPVAVVQPAPYTPPPAYTAPPAYTPPPTPVETVPAGPAWTPPAPAGGDVYYGNCAAARAAGAAPIMAGQPGYRSGLDRDGDGIACE